MSPRKETRLFIFVTVVLALGIGIRTFCVARLNRYTPQWVRASGTHIAQAATLPSVATNAVQKEVPSGTQALRSSAVSASTTVAVKQAATSSLASSAAPDADHVSSPVTPPTTDASTVDPSCVNPDGSRRLNLNTATAAELDTLPGIGPSYAAAILQERAKRGQFTTIQQLLDVKGIGPARFAKIEPLVCVVVVPASS